MSNFLMGIGLLSMLVSIVLLIKPKIINKSFTRKNALLTFMGGLLLMFIGGLLAPPTVTKIDIIAEPKSASIDTTPSEDIKPLPNFDIPALLDKNIDQITKSLGGSKNDTEPTKLQLSMMSDNPTWDKSFENGGVTLLVTYNPKTRVVTDFFIPSFGDQNKNKLLVAGNIQENSTTYEVEFVKAIIDPNKLTGIKVIPKK